MSARSPMVRAPPPFLPRMTPTTPVRPMPVTTSSQPKLLSFSATTPAVRCTSNISSGCACRSCRQALISSCRSATRLTIGMAILLRARTALLTRLVPGPDQLANRRGAETSIAASACGRLDLNCRAAEADPFRCHRHDRACFRPLRDVRHRLRRVIKRYVAQVIRMEAPPSNGQEIRDQAGFEAVSDQFGRNATDDRVRRNVFWSPPRLRQRSRRRQS